MKYQATVTVLGMKGSKGRLDNGMAYDSTTVYCVVDMDNSKGMALGQAAGDFKMGLASEIEAFRAQSFPFKGIGDFEVVTNGAMTKTILHKLVPAPAAK